MYTKNKIETFRPAYRRGYELSRRHLIFCLLITALLCLTAASNTASAATYTYYVDIDHPDANDVNPGTEELPWKTLTKAANTAQASDIVSVKAGIYRETLAPVNSGTTGNLITFKAYPGENAVIDGEYTRTTVDLADKSYIRVEGFEIRYTAGDGVHIQPSGTTYGIEIVNNHIHHGLIAEPYLDHSGICIRGGAADGIFIYGNNIHHNYWNGISPYSLSVSNLSIINNDIHYNGNDGIQQGRGSNWLIEGNRIYDWWKEVGERPALSAHPDGIQIFRSIDGLIIRNNVIWDQHQNIFLQPLGPPLVEDLEVIENVEIYGNLIYNDDAVWPPGNPKGIFLDVAAGGSMKNVKIYGNTVYDMYFGIIVQGDASNITIRNNIIADISVNGIGLVESISSEYISSNYNLFFNEKRIVWGGNNYYTLSDFQTATGQDLNSIEADPEFVDASSFDFHLQPTSPAIDTGEPALAAIFTLPSPFLDIDGTERPQGSGYDIGAYEYLSGPPDTTPPSVPQNLTAQAISEFRIDLSWLASTDPESGVSYYRIYRDGSEIDTSVSTSYSNTGLSSDTTYSYEVSAVNGAGLESGLSNTSQATTLSDTTAPTILSVAASETSVEIAFSESLDTISAEQISNYSINNGVSITAASLDTDTVILTTSAHTEGLTYTLTVVNVQDTSGNPMTETTTDYEYDDGLVAHWKFDDGSGNSAVDSSGNNNTGTLINGPTWTTGKTNGGLSFDGVDDAVEIGTAGLSSGSGTIALWSYAVSFATTGQYLFGHATQPWANRIQFYTDDIEGYLDLGLGDSHTRHTNIENLATQRWYHIALTWDGSNYTVYVDGSARATGAYSGLSTLETYADIGNTGNRADRTEAFNGIIDEVRIYNRALSTDEVLELYNSAPPAIFNIQETNITSSGATITWNTDENSTSQVEYGLDTSYGNATDLDTSLVTSHSVLLTGLASETLYHYHVRSKDASGNESISQDNTFPTSGVSTYSITASASGGGTISPSGTTQVASGGSQTYTITANAGYEISDVLVDGSSVGPVTSYPFTNVTANHTIAVTFAINTYTITASASDGGTISPSGTTQVASGSSQTYTITANPGYDISDVLVDGSSVGPVTSYPFTNVTANHTIAVTFAINTYTITASASDGGTISPSGTTQVASGSSQTYTITANPGYDISDVLVDGSSVGAVTSYPFTDVTANHTIAATFAIDEVDETAPTVANCAPDVNSIQAPLNTLVILDITDSGDGVDANSVTVKVNNNIVYTGNTNHYPSADGDCRRLGTKADYKFIYHQWKQNFDFDQPINITVNATDLAGNIMDEYSYSFKSEMRSFGENKILSSGSSNDNWGPLTTVSDSSGNIWVAWPQGVVGSRDIYVGKLVAGTDSFVSSGVVPVTNDIPDQGNPVIAVDSSDKLYLAWQDNRYGEWDIFVSTSTDGINWSAETRVTDSNDNQINPAIVVNSSNNTYIVWQDDRHGNQDIYVAESSNGFVTKTPITSDPCNQAEPAIAADSDNTIYVVWTDTRNSKNDIYGAASNGSWTNIPIVTEEESQSNPAIATEADGSILHLVWLDDTPGDDDIYYATSDGLPASPLTGSSIIDPCEPGADQISPVIITTGYTGNDLRVFACWRDERNKDVDLYAVEIGAGAGTNVFVGDDDTSTDQSEPAIGIDGYGHPYLVWINERMDICYAGSTFIEPVVLASSTASVSSKTTVGTVPGSITNIDDVSTEVPQGAYLCDVKVTISRIRNPHKPPSNNRTFLYEYGPSGTTFSEPVTITIPYNATSLVSSPSAYWYNPLTGLYSQEGITDVEVIQISSGLYALRFKTTHFSIFGGGGSFDDIFGGGGGGGCSMSPNNQGSIVEFLLPYIGLTVVMTILKLRDRRKNKMHDITKSEC